MISLTCSIAYEHTNCDTSSTFPSFGGSGGASTFSSILASAEGQWRSKILTWDRYLYLYEEQATLSHSHLPITSPSPDDVSTTLDQTTGPQTLHTSRAVFQNCPKKINGQAHLSQAAQTCNSFLIRRSSIAVVCVTLSAKTVKHLLWEWIPILVYWATPAP